MTATKPRRPTLKAEMTPFPYSIDEGRSLEDARAMMDEHGIHHLPVVRDGDLAGIITETQLAGVAASGDKKVGDIFDAHGYVVEIDEDLVTVGREMATRDLDAAVVVRRGKLVGIFTARDACRVLADLVLECFATPGDDEIA